MEPGYLVRGIKQCPFPGARPYVEINKMAQRVTVDIIALLGGVDQVLLASMK